jgi:hypothetical protein
MIESIDTTPHQNPFWNGLKQALSLPWLPFALAVLFIALDQFSGPFIQFPALFVIPVALAAWYATPRIAMLLAVGQPFVNLAITLVLGTGSFGFPPSMIALNAGIRAVVLLVLAYFVSRTASQNKQLARRVGLLRGEIPVCFSCHKAQDERNNWLPLDIYVARHTEANFTEALCPECTESKRSGR